MTDRLILTNQSGVQKKAYLGWSWTSFFFGGIPSIFRGDMYGFFMWVLISVVLIVATLPFSHSAYFLFLGFQIVGWAALYNTWHAKRLLENGYTITSSGISVDEALARINS